MLPLARYGCPRAPAGAVALARLLRATPLFEGWVGTLGCLHFCLCALPEWIAPAATLAHAPVPVGACAQVRWPSSR